VTEAIPYRSIERMKLDLGIYGSDQWTLKRLTLNLALRYDHLNDFVPALTQPANVYIGERALPAVPCVPCWADWSPRLGAAYDLTGDGKTSVKGSFGKYVAAQSPNASRAQCSGGHLRAHHQPDWLTRASTRDSVVGTATTSPLRFSTISQWRVRVVDNLNFGRASSRLTSDPAILTAIAACNGSRRLSSSAS
jgi:hypothetical protein